MKKTILIVVVLFNVFLLIACSGSPTQETFMNEADNSKETSFPMQGNETDVEIPLQTRLIIGAFELEDSEYEVTSEQAAELIPLWKVLKNLLESETAAVEEIDALVNQISETMTESQMDLINNLELTSQSASELMMKMGITENLQRPDGANYETDQNGQLLQRPEGMPMQPPEGMPMQPGMGGGVGEVGGNLSQEQLEAMQANRQAVGGGGFRPGMMGNSLLIDALIELLESK